MSGSPSGIQVEIEGGRLHAGAVGGVRDGGGAEVTAEGGAGGAGQSEVPVALRAHAAAAVPAAHLPAAHEGAPLARQRLRQGGLAVAGKRESPLF